MRQSYDKARGVTGEEGQIRTRTNENLNEAAKFAVLSKFAQGLGIAKDDNDFKGMYDLHKQHHGEDSLTLSNPGAVSLLNQRMKDMGYSTRFKAGDRIRVNFDEQGNIESAFAVRGASRESSDITSEIKGYESNYLNVSRQTTGFRGEHGFMDTSYNYKRTIGTGLVEMGRDEGREADLRRRFQGGLFRQEDRRACGGDLDKQEDGAIHGGRVHRHREKGPRDRQADQSASMGHRHDGTRQGRVLRREGFSVPQQRGSGEGRWEVRLGDESRCGQRSQAL